MPLFRRGMWLFLLLTSATWSTDVWSAEHRAEALSEPPPTDIISAEIADLLAHEGIKVIRGASRTVCEIWPAKQWDVKADFTPSSEVLYPFEPGAFVGVLRFPRRGADFREQRMSRGVYILRYGQQPIDGNHEGTSPTRDFLLLVSAEEDRSPERTDVEKLMKDSAAAADSTHPALIALKKAADTNVKLSVRHDEDRDLWIMQVVGKANAGGTLSDLPVALVVAGHAEE